MTMSDDDIELLARGAWRIYKEHGPSDAMTWDRFGEHGKETWRDIVRSVLAAAQPPADDDLARLRRIEAAVRDLFEAMPMKARLYLAEHHGEVNRAWLELDLALLPNEEETDDD